MRTGARRTDVVFLIAAVGLRMLPGQQANLGFVVLALYATLGRTQTIWALTISWLFTMVSPGLVSSMDVSAGRYLVIAVAAFAALLRGLLQERGPVILRPTFITIGLGAAIALHSLLFSGFPLVSVLKIMSWTMAAGTVIDSWSRLDVKERDRLSTDLMIVLGAVVVGSVPLMGLGVGYMRNGSGFQGILNHPQAFGFLSAVTAAWFGVRALSSRRPPWGLVLITGISLMFIVLSEARTAALGALLGVGIAVLDLFLRERGAALRQLPGLLSGRVYGMVVVAMVAALLLWPVVTRNLDAFLSKRGGGGSLIELYQDSRGALLDQMLANIQLRPLTGIGFGVASQAHEMQVTADSLIGLPVSASVEKGVAPVAWLEELGVFGFALVMGWTIAMVRRTRRNGPEAMAVIAVVLVMNLAESVLFSAGGTGMLVLVLLGWAVRTPAPLVPVLGKTVET